MSKRMTFRAFANLVAALVLFPYVLEAADLFGLSHSCTGNTCRDNRLICVDPNPTPSGSEPTCNITCVDNDSCNGATVVIANTGGLQLLCESDRSCKQVVVEWANTENLAEYTALHPNATVGGALKSLECGGNNDACKQIQVMGESQENGLDIITEWLCYGKKSCSAADVEFAGTVSLYCSGDASCNDFILTCLSGGNCETSVSSVDVSIGATMYCMPQVETCNCMDGGFECISVTTPKPTTTTNTDTTKLMSTDSVTTETETTTVQQTGTPETTTTEEPDESGGGGNSDNSTGIIIGSVLGGIIVLLIVAYFVYIKYYKKTTLSELMETNVKDERVEKAQKEGADIMNETTLAAGIDLEQLRDAPTAGGPQSDVEGAGEKGQLMEGDAETNYSSALFSSHRWTATSKPTADDRQAEVPKKDSIPKPAYHRETATTLTDASIVISDMGVQENEEEEEEEHEEEEEKAVIEDEYVTPNGEFSASNGLPLEAPTEGSVSISEY